MTTLLQNPYKQAQVETRRLTTHVGTKDWERIWTILPIHGLQDRLIATLYKKFIDLTSHELPRSYNLDTETALISLLERLTLAPTPGPGPDDNDGRGNP